MGWASGRGFAGSNRSSTPLPSAAPELDDAGRIRSVTLRQGSGDGYVALAAGSIRNSTEHTDADLRAAVTTQNLPFVVEKNSALPQVLKIYYRGKRVK